MIFHEGCHNLTVGRVVFKSDARHKSSAYCSFGLPSTLQMSGTLFSKTARRDSPQPRGAPSNEPQVDRSAPPSHSEGGWSCDEPYKYPIKSSKNSLEKFHDILERHDKGVYAQMKEEINFLMVVAGLFLAIVSAFTIESYKFLQEDKQDTMSDLLVEVVRLLNDTSAQGKAQLPKPFEPKHHDIVVNQLWFLSLILSLVAVAMGIFWLQWIAAFQQGTLYTKYYSPPHEWHALQLLRIEGLEGWGVSYAVVALLFTVQLSIGLFIFGLIYFFWNVSETATIPALVAASFAGALIILVNLLPFLQPLVTALLPATMNLPQCPYKSPTSWLVRSTGNILPYSIKLFLNLLLSDWVKIVGRPGRWLKNLPFPFTDFHWMKYDKICQDFRDSVCSRLSYFQFGFYNACYLLDDKDVIDVMPDYLGDLAGSFATTEDWKVFSQQELSQDEKSFLNGDFALASHHVPCRLSTPSLRLKYVNKIKTDFISALVLQHRTPLPRKFTRLLLPHHVELYIRVKNTTKFILSSDGSRLDFGQSLNCPFKGHFHKIINRIEELDLELKFQFLRCVKHLIDTRRSNDHDILSAAAIVQSESAASMTLSRISQNLSESQRMDPPAEEEHTEPLPNQSSPKNDQIVDPGTISSPPNESEEGRSESAAHDDTSGEDPQLRTSFTILCSQVKEQLLWLRRSDFKNENYYVELREAFGLPVEPGQETIRTEIVIDVPDHKGT
ncbi:hypothetical protein Agabi119p4_1372 [Agaricus bisporus var. burnettii]|uniref:DUF6535 domain-containing protein n=1 Tax=Agaricus bisporus var. burnettii TaxID=192524 RepID=A0A8H7FCB0_AGABI|nr:hypothetical protein Agabi119p4_1372 [Agaricus bisporus var. burnettii]